MKIKAILIALTLSAVSVFGQGLVTFQNSSISTPIRLPGGALIPAGGQAYSFYFVYGPTLANTSATYFNSDTLNGRITLVGTSDISIPNAPGSVPTTFQLYAYSSAAGSYANAQTAPGAYYYQSGIITQTPSSSPSPGTPLFGVTPGTSFQGFTFNQTSTIPEPSTIALGILGAGSLLMLRRKK